MSFKFNFGGTADDREESPTKSEPVKTFRPCLVHEFDLSSDRASENFEHFQWNTLEIEDLTMRFVDPEYASSRVTNSKIASLIMSSDLNSGEYEGGLKVWECTYDLVQYLHENDVIASKTRVMDMGCGAGLLGLYSFLKGADMVYFQDYNSEVIDVFTLPTISASLKHNNISDANERVKLISGDWEAVSRDIKDKEQFDLILSSETIYNIEYYPKIRDFLQDLLAPKGRALFAAKAHYFGVGGGTFDFVNFMIEAKLFNVEVVKKIDEGLTREILQVTKNEQNVN